MMQMTGIKPHPEYVFTCWTEAALVLGRCSMEDKLLDMSFSMMSFAIWNDSATVSVTASAYHTFTDLLIHHWYR